MFTYKFAGLAHEDAPTPYYYGSLSVKPRVSHVLFYDETRNRYKIVHVVGRGLEGEDTANQRKLADAEIGRGENVPTVYLKKLQATKTAKKTDIQPTGLQLLRRFEERQQNQSQEKNKGACVPPTCQGI